MSARYLVVSLSLACALTSGCGDDKKSSSAQEVVDAAMIELDAAASYRGPTRGGVVPDAPTYEEPEPDKGPFDASVPCCDQTLSFAALDGETVLVIEADSAPLDGAKPALQSGTFTVALCMPLGVAINYRLHVTVDSDAGPVERVRVDADKPSFEDAESALWNVFAQQTCDAE